MPTGNKGVLWALATKENRIIGDKAILFLLAQKRPCI